MEKEMIDRQRKSFKKNRMLGLVKGISQTIAELTWLLEDVPRKTLKKIIKEQYGDEYEDYYEAEYSFYDESMKAQDSITLLIDIIKNDSK